jgi:hypothetical protein
MITFLVIKILDMRNATEPEDYWYGAAFGILVDAFLLSVLIYLVRTWLAF